MLCIKAPNCKWLHGHCYKQRYILQECTPMYWELILFPVKKLFRIGPWSRNFARSSVELTATHIFSWPEVWWGQTFLQLSTRCPQLAPRNGSCLCLLLKNTASLEISSIAPACSQGQGLLALGSHPRWSPAAPLPAHELLQGGGGGRTLQATLSSTLCSTFDSRHPPLCHQNKGGTLCWKQSITV